MMAEQEVTLFHEQLVAVRKALARSEAENEKLQKQLDQQVPKITWSWLILHSESNASLLSIPVTLMENFRHWLFRSEVISEPSDN